MSKILIITIGSRDIQIAKDTLVNLLGQETVNLAFKHPTRGDVNYLLARPAGELILKNLKIVKDNLQYPIITPFLQLMLTKHSQFERVLLISTNQLESISEEFRIQDTTFHADIITQYIKTSFSVKGQAAFPKVSKLDVQENVVYLDAMFNFFKERLLKSDMAYLQDASEIHVCNQGGIDAINTGLMLQLLYRFGEKTFLYNVNEQTRLCTMLNFQHQFGFEQEKARLQLAVARFDFAAAKALNLPKYIKDFSAYAESRLNFDFNQALTYLTALPNQFGELRDQEIVDLQRIQQGEYNLTAELYWNAILRYQQAAYVDFVQRFFRIVEQISKSEAQKILDFEIDHDKWETEIKHFLNNPKKEKLKQYLEQYKTPSGTQLALTTANIEVFLAIISSENHDVYSFLSSLRPLAQLRNKGIGAHGFNPISKENILSKMKMTEQDFDQMLEKVGRFVNAGNNPYARIQNRLRTLTQQAN